jgi:hypothetical protein
MHALPYYETNNAEDIRITKIQKAFQDSLPITHATQRESTSEDILRGRVSRKRRVRCARSKRGRVGVMKKLERAESVLSVPDMFSVVPQACIVGSKKILPFALAFTCTHDEKAMLVNLRRTRFPTKLNMCPA